MSHDGLESAGEQTACTCVPPSPTPPATAACWTHMLVARHGPQCTPAAGASRTWSAWSRRGSRAPSAGPAVQGEEQRGSVVGAAWKEQAHVSALRTEGWEAVGTAPLPWACLQLGVCAPAGSSLQQRGAQCGPSARTAGRGGWGCRRPTGAARPAATAASRCGPPLPHRLQKHRAGAAAHRRGGRGGGRLQQAAGLAGRRPLAYEFTESSGVRVGEERVRLWRQSPRQGVYGRSPFSPRWRCRCPAAARAWLHVQPTIQDHPASC